MEPCVLQDFQEIKTSEITPNKITLPRASVFQREGLEISREGLEAFFKFIFSPWKFNGSHHFARPCWK